MRNLLTETLEVLAFWHKEPKDIDFVSDEIACYTWDDFVAAANIEYNESYGCAKINDALKVVGVGNNWWLEREEYDGAEWWNYKIRPLRENYDSPPGAIRILESEGV